MDAKDGAAAGQVYEWSNGVLWIVLKTDLEWATILELDVRVRTLTVFKDMWKWYPVRRVV